MTCKRSTGTWKDALHQQPLGKCQSKSQWDTMSHPPGWLKSERQTLAGADENVEKLEPSYSAGRNLKWCFWQRWENNLAGVQMSEHRVTICPALTLPETIEHLEPRTDLYTNVHSSIIHNSPKKWKQPKCPSTGKWLNERCYVHTFIIYYQQ